MKAEKPLRALTLDISAFKKRFNKLSSMSSYERANTIALENKRAKWAAYRPLAREQLYDNLGDSGYMTILTPNASRAPKRSTKNGILFAQSTVIHRPTEILAIIHALGFYKFMEEDWVVRQDPNKILWWCIECERFKAPTEFAPDKHHLQGLAYACKVCQRQEQRTVWKRAA
jgi:hypothetical protein